MNEPQATKPSAPMRLQHKLILLVTGLLAVLILILSAIYVYQLGSIIEQQIGSKALLVAQSVAQIPAVRTGIPTDDPTGEIQRITENIRGRVGAEFVVVGNHEGRRLSHPNPENIGRFMVGDDNQPALEEGRSYVSVATGTLGPSIRGKTPVFSDDGEIIGVVSVGFLLEEVRQSILRSRLQLLPLVASVLFLGAYGAIVIARNIKRQIHGLEPAEIAKLLQERTAILESIREGVIACDRFASLTMANRSALRHAQAEDMAELERLLTSNPLHGKIVSQVLHNGERILGQEMTINGNALIFNIIPSRQEAVITGAVASFRPKDEVDILSRELSSLKQYADLLRVQSHEYSNKLHTISGLIQTGAYDEALDFIVKEGSHLQDIVSKIVQVVPDPLLSAMILGKFTYAQELKVDFSLNTASEKCAACKTIESSKLITIMGNLLDNAFEAASLCEEGKRQVQLLMKEVGRYLILEVEDTGTGIGEEIQHTLFDKGVSTKSGQNRGIGLYLVKETVHDLGGTIRVGQASLGGARFTIALPIPGRESL